MAVVIRFLILAGIAGVVSAVETARPGPAWAQPVEPGRVLFTLDASPSGPAIALDGGERIVGPTPLLIPTPLDGRYRLSVVEPGFESPSGDVVFRSRGGGLTLDGYDRGLWLERPLRSALVPGLGQMHAGAPVRGWGFLVATIGLGIGTLAAESDFLDARDEVRRLNEGGDGAGTSEADVRRIARLEAVKEQDQAYRTRNVWATAAVGVWGLSVLDAAFFIPSFDLRLMKPDLLTIEAHQKTPAARALRSAFLPGLGQFYGGSPLRGTFYLGAEAAAVTIAVSAHLRYQDANDEALFLRERARIEEQIGEPAAAEGTRGEYLAALGRRDDRYDLRNQALAAAGAVWFLSIVDALLFEESGAVKGNRADADNSHGDGVRLAWRPAPNGARLSLLVGF